MPATLILAMLLAVCGAHPSVAAGAPDPVPKRAVLAVGDPLSSFVLKDQNGAEVRIDDSVGVLVFTRDMTGGALVKEALAERGRETLAKANAIYLSDISGMPSFVRYAFGLPALRKRPYPVALDEGGALTSNQPYREGSATILHLEAGKVVSVTFASTSAEVAAALRR